MLYFVSAQDPVSIPRLNLDYHQHQQSLDDYLLLPRAYHHAPAREQYLGGHGHGALFEDPLYSELGGLGSSEYLSDPYGTDYLYEAQLLQARRAAFARRRQVQLQRQREQEQIAIALRQAELRRQQAERQRQAALIQRARQLELQRQRQAQLAHREQAQQVDFATQLLTSLFVGDEPSALPEVHKPKAQPQAANLPQARCGNCQCQRAPANHETPKPQAAPAAEPTSAPFVHPFLQLAAELGLPALFEQGIAGADLQRRCAMRGPSEKQHTEAAAGDDSHLTDPARRQSLDNLGLIRAEFDLARMEMETGASSSAHFEEKLIHILEKLDGVESEGDESVRTIRRSLARDLSFALDSVELAKSTKKVDGDAEKKVHFEETAKDSTALVAPESVTPAIPSAEPQEVTAVQVNALENHVSDAAPLIDDISAHHAIAEDSSAHSFPPQVKAAEEPNLVDFHSVTTESSLDAADHDELEAAVALSLSSSGEEDTDPTPIIKRRHTIDTTGHDHDTVLVHSDGESEGSVKGYEVL